MRFRLLRTGFLAMVAVGVVLAVPASSHAVFTLTLSQTGFANLTITDNVAPDQNGTLGVIATTQELLGPTGGGLVYGDYRIGITSQAFSFVGSGSANLTAITNVVVTRIGTTNTNALQLVMSESSFGSAPFEAMPNGLYNLNNSLTVNAHYINSTTTPTTVADPGIAGLTVSSTASATPNLATTPTVTSNSSVFSGSSNTLFNKTATPFTMSHTLVVTGVNVNQAVQFQASSVLTNVTPAPSSVVLALAGLPMIGLFGWLRARRKNVEMAGSIA